MPRAKKSKTAQAMAFAPVVRGQNRLEVRNDNSSDEAEIILIGAIGKSWWDDSGITEQEVRDAIKSVPKGKRINARINSEGGSVKEGLGIYNAFKERRNDITSHITGYALSIASVFPLGAGKVISPKSAIWMMHKAWSWTQGNADDMRQAADMLETHDETLVDIYASETGKTKEEIRDAMEQETWVKGADAVDFGLADETDKDDAAASAAIRQRPLDQGFIDRCKNLPADILNALRSPQAPNNSAAPSGGQQQTTQENQMNKKIIVALLKKHGIEASETETEEQLQAKLDTIPKATAQPPPAPAPTNVVPLPAPGDALAQVSALKKKLLTNRVTEYVKAQKITKAEVPLFVTAALEDEEGTFAILDARTGPQSAAPLGASGIEVVEYQSVAPVRGNPLALARYPALREPVVAKRYAALRGDWDSMIADALAQDEARNAPLIRQNIMPMNANTYSATLVTAFLTDGATTVLQHRLAPIMAFSRDFSTDPYKPNAVAQHKFVTVGPTVQTDATNFESGNSTVAPITITPHQYTSSANVSNADLNNGLRMENLTTIAAAVLANKVIEVCTVPISKANFAGTFDVGGGATNVVTAANFAFTTLQALWGALQKSPIKNLILDGTYLAKLLNLPTYFQQYSEMQGAWKAFGWDLIALNSDWTGASDNAIGFACDPQAIAVLAGLPLTPPQGIPGNTLAQSSFTLPGVELSVATYSWFNLGARTAWMSYDVVLGAAKMDGTAGILVASA